MLACWFLSVHPMPDASAVSPEPSAAVQDLMLDNGLQVAWQEDHRQPLVAIEVRIKGGLRGEGALLGTGVTHFIEHMLFKGTPSRPPGTIDQEVRRYGGSINAFTSFDTTGVSLFVESRYLRDALSLLADILQHAVFDPAEAQKEQAVIVSEIQMNQDDPERRIHQLFWSRHFLEHPYRHPILGYQPLLEQLTAQDLAAFYRAQYQPQNITIVCVGDLDGSRLPALAKELFAGWPRGRFDPSAAVVPAEPPAVSAKHAAVDLPVGTAYVLLGFSSVRLNDPDLYALDVLANILGDGRSSRLYERVVRQQQLAHAAAAWNYTPADPGVFAVQFRTDLDKVEPAIQAVTGLIAEVQRDGVTDAELAKAKRSVSASYLFGLQTIEAKASDLASSLASTGDALFSRRYVEQVQAVTAAQVQAVAQRFCDPAKMTTAVIRPQSADTPAAPAAPAPAEISMTRATLKNGTTVLIGVDRTLPITGMAVAFRGGIRVESEPTQGLCNLVAHLLTKGTKRKSAVDMARQVESLGGSLEPFSGRDGFGLILQLLSQDVDDGLGLLHEAITQSTFPEDELVMQRELIVKQLRAEDDEIFTLGGRLLRRTLFPQHPYRFHPLGDAAILPTLTRRDCEAFAKRWMVPSNMVIAVFGDLEPAVILRKLEASFGAMPAGKSPWPDRLPEEPLDAVREERLHLEREQALVMLGFRGSTHIAADRYAVDVLTAALSGMSGRLFQSVREAQGLSYTLGAVHVPGWDPGYLLVYAATRPKEQATVLRLLEEQLARTAADGLTAEEIAQAKRHLIGQHRMELQHLVGLARRCAIDELFGLGYDAWKRYEASINAVTPAMVHEAAQRYLTMQRRAGVIVSPNGHAH